LQTRVRLVCFPYAGAGTSALRSWSQLLPSFVETRIIQLPGRGSLFREAPFTAIEPLVQWVVQRESAVLQPPFALFGHSLGALVAFEVARALRRMGHTLPLCIIVSGRTAPQLPDPNEPVHALPLEALRARLKSLGGTPPELLENEELMNLIIPTLRADFQVSETYRYTAEAPLKCPIVALGGTEDDTTPVEALLMWREQTTSYFRHHLFRGGHFFIHTATQSVITACTSELRALLDTPASIAP
jgi:medium-chain acyl-[acyl-carrier-protein] hydrolase